MFSVSLVLGNQSATALAVTKSRRWKQSRTKKKTQQAAVSLAADEELMDAAVAADLSGPDGNFTSEDEQKNGTEGFSRWTACFLFTPDRL